MTSGSVTIDAEKFNEVMQDIASSPAGVTQTVTFVRSAMRNAEPIGRSRMIGRLAREFEVDLDDIATFAMRVTALARVGLCHHRKSGKGKRGAYDAADYLAYYVATKLNLCGIGRERAIEITNEIDRRLSPETPNQLLINLRPAFGSRGCKVAVDIPPRILASAIEARRATTAQTGVVGDESAAAESRDAQKPL